MVIPIVQQFQSHVKLNDERTINFTVSHDSSAVRTWHQVFTSRRVARIPRELRSIKTLGGAPSNFRAPSANRCVLIPAVRAPRSPANLPDFPFRPDERKRKVSIAQRPESPGRSCIKQAPRFERHHSRSLSMIARLSEPKEENTCIIQVVITV